MGNGASLKLVRSTRTEESTVECPSIMSIIQAVCEHFNVSQVELCGSRRSQNLIIPRHIAYWLCTELTMASFPQIARMFNFRDHTTVMYGACKIQDEVKASSWIGAEAQKLAAIIRAEMAQ